jgi:hypothetical protein
MYQLLIPAVTKLIGKAIDRAVPDKDEAMKIKAQANALVHEEGQAELEAATKIVLAEAQGASWLQRSWRPIVMLTFCGLVVAHWMGFTAENLKESEITGLLDIVKIGLGGYVVGRSGEKIMREYKKG